MKKISIVVPCYNEKEALPIFYNEVIPYLTPEYFWNLILVDDGSKDTTLDIMRSLAERDSRVKYVSFSRNFGKEAAMYAGLEAAVRLDSDMAIIMDVDLQDPPSMISELLAAYDEGYKLIFTKHVNRKESWFKKFCVKSFYRIYAFLTHDNSMKQGGRDFSLLDRKVIEAFLSIKDHERFTKGIYHFVGFKQKCIEFDYQSRRAGKTKWSFKKLFSYAMLGIREFSEVITWVPVLLSFLFGGIFVYDVIAGAIGRWLTWPVIRDDLFRFLAFVCLSFITKLIYEVRNQCQHRPIYIESESNIETDQKRDQG